MCIHDIYLAHSCNRCAGGSDIAGVRGSQPEPEVQEADEAAAAEELPECPNHRPSSFLKGKPRSILSVPCFYKYLYYLLFVDDALSIGIGWNQLLHYISIIVQISHWNPI